MRNFIFLTLALSLSIAGRAQKYDYIWLLGKENDHTLPGHEFNHFDFREEPVAITSLTGVALEFGSTSASMSDAEGNLLFYSNGCQIANAQHTIMDNGEGINPGEVHDLYCPITGFNAYPAVNQNMLPLPDPGSDSRYYLFHKSAIITDGGGFDVVTDRLYYSLIDMSENEGLGRVVEKNVLVIQDSLTAGRLTATRHANGRDWWIIDSREFSGRYYVFLLDTAGIHSQMVQAIGVPTVAAGSGGGQASFSPQGDLYAHYAPADDIHLFDFDRSTGTLSNFRHIPVPMDTVVGGLAFSPSGRYLYISAVFNIQQYDLWAEDIAASGQVVAVYDGYLSPLPTSFLQSQLGPDCKIYVFCPSCDVVHVIHEPDEPGMACRVEQHAIQLPWGIFRSAALYPHYRLGSIDNPGEPCSPVVSTSSSPEVRPLRREGLAYPNPGSDLIHILPGLPNDPVVDVKITDALGRTTAVTWSWEDERLLRVNVSQLPQGAYYALLLHQSGQWSSARWVKK